MLKVFEEIKVAEFKYCVLCLRTCRPLQNSCFLSQLMQSLDSKDVWLWKTNPKLDIQVCLICEERLSETMNTLKIIKFAVQCAKLLESLKKSWIKTFIGTHLEFMEKNCEREMAAVRRLTDAPSTIDNNDKIQNLRNEFSTQKTKKVSQPCKAQTSESKLKKLLTKNPYSIQQQSNPLQLQINPIPQQTDLIQLLNNTVQQQSNLLQQQSNLLQQQINPIQLQTNFIQQQTNPIEQQKNPIQVHNNPVVNKTTEDIVIEDVDVKSETLSITEEDDLQNLQTIEEIEEHLESTEVKSEVSSEVEESILPDLPMRAINKTHNKKSETNKNIQSHSKPGPKNNAVQENIDEDPLSSISSHIIHKNAVQMDRSQNLNFMLAQSEQAHMNQQQNPIIPPNLINPIATNPIQSQNYTITPPNQRLLACALQNGDMAFCPIVTCEGKDYVPALKSHLENGVLTPIVADWDKIVQSSNNPAINELVSSLDNVPALQNLLSSIQPHLNSIPKLPMTFGYPNLPSITNISSNAMQVNYNPPQMQQNFLQVQPLQQNTPQICQESTSIIQNNIQHFPVPPLAQNTVQNTNPLSQNSIPNSIQFRNNIKHKVVDKSSNVAIRTNPQKTVPKKVKNFDLVHIRLFDENIVKQCKKLNLKIPKLRIPKLTVEQIRRHCKRKRENYRTNRNPKMDLLRPESSKKVSEHLSDEIKAASSVASNENNYPLFYNLYDSVASNEKHNKLYDKVANNVKENTTKDSVNSVASNVQPKRTDESIDWEDKIPMDVITYMDATDPNPMGSFQPPPRKVHTPPKKDKTNIATRTISTTGTQTQTAFGVISSCVGADDVIFID